jgi:hypothetical protein
MSAAEEAAYGLRATVLVAATGLITAVTVAGISVSGWRAGSLDDRVEWIFWAGAILGAVAVGLFGFAAVPGRTSRRIIQAAMALFLLAPVLCMVAVFGSYWI